MKPLRPEPPSSSWWRFAGEEETFIADRPDQLSRLYFPLCNEAGLLSAVTPCLNGDVKTGQDTFLSLPVSTEDLHNTRSRRNFWVVVDGRDPWSIAAPSKEKSVLEAGALWHRLTREQRRLGLRADILNFVPAGSATVEIMQVKLTNFSHKPIKLTATAAVPIFGRSADNLRDHRHVTSLLHRIVQHAHGVLVCPAMSFDGRGHRFNQGVYAVWGLEEDGEPPIGTFPTVESFIGEGGDFDRPRAVLEDWDPPDLDDVQRQGREAVGALRFKSRKLAPGKSVTYTLLLGIAHDRKEADSWLRTFGSGPKVAQALEQTKQFWKEQLDRIQVRTDDLNFNRWVRWVALQPILRKIFGNSFLPDFDYGRGGRGWRDLWQDSLALILLDNTQTPALEAQGSGLRAQTSGNAVGAHSPEPGVGVRSLLLNNFGGVRMNGSNTTIIGRLPGEFIADRDNISRVWMDHGVWPWFATEFYLQQSGDWEFLLEETPYFWDQDKALAPAAERGTVFEHLLVQHLAAYFNVGDHGNCRLEDADWNDGFDMARERGESVPFTAFYAGNLLRMAQALRLLQEKRGLQELALGEELEMLLEHKVRSVDLAPAAKRERLRSYRAQTQAGVSGRKIMLSIETLVEDLQRKGTALAEHVRQHEWITNKAGHSWFNGYYDNAGDRVEGDHPGGVRLTLTGQVFPILAGVAREEQIERSFLAAKHYLQDRKFGGFRLNTDFGEAPPPLGRAFYFAYGEKENGSFFSHMVVTFAYALYQRGFVKEGHEVLSSLQRMCLNTEVAKIYPGIPEYFNSEGRGMYHYLTGSASWYLLTLVTQVFGVRGQWGDLLLAPKLMPEQFGPSGQAVLQTDFAGKCLKVTYVNREKKPYGKYRIESVMIQGRSQKVPPNAAAEFLVSRKTLLDLPEAGAEITVALS
jgi:cellobiose phosphorylase